jgi:predicted nucleotidyltransferase
MAKELASENLGISVLPSNYDVAVELDRLADEFEGWERRITLMEMRRTALKIMRVIKGYEPCLIGSVWRGTARKGSDIDITVYTEDVKGLKDRLQGFIVKGVEDTTYHVEGRLLHSIHVYLNADGYDAEVVIRHPKDKSPERCEVFGDIKKGLRIDALDKLMKIDPLRRFIPRKQRR